MAPAPPPGLKPPVTSTVPLFSKVAEWNARAMDIEPVAEKVSEVGSYNSALDNRRSKGNDCRNRSEEHPLTSHLLPPTINTLPSGSKVAVWEMRGTSVDVFSILNPASVSTTAAVAALDGSATERAVTWKGPPLIG